MPKMTSKNFGPATIRNYEGGIDPAYLAKLVIDLHGGWYVGRDGLDSFKEKDILFDTLEEAEEVLALYLLKQAGPIIESDSTST